MTAKEAAEFLDLIAERAQVLRERGVRRVELGGVAFVLAELEIEAPPAGTQPDDDQPVDELRDPWIYGRPGPDEPKVRPRRTRAPLVGADE